MDGLPPPPPGLDIYESRTANNYAGSLVPFILAIITVGLRFTSRRLADLRFLLDDWLILVALVIDAILILSTVAWAIPSGLGRHIWVLAPTAGETWAKYLFIASILYPILICLIKFSLLALYWRTFGIDRTIRIPVIVVAVITSCWAIGAFVAAVLQCIPPSEYWERFSPLFNRMPHCPVNDEDYFYSISIPNIITDLIIIVMPIPFLWRLNMKTSQKILVSAIFLLGFMLTAVSLARFILILKQDLSSPDVTFNTYKTVLLTNIEVNFGIICACLPAFRPVIALVIRGYESLSRLSRSIRSGSSGSRKNSDNMGGRRHRLPDAESEGIELTTSQGSTQAGNSTAGIHEDGLPKIQVT